MCWNKYLWDKNIIFYQIYEVNMVLKSKNELYLYIYININKINWITKLQFVFWNRVFKRLVREIRPSDFPETTTVGFALEISFQLHQLCKDPTVGLSGMFNSNLKKNSARNDYIYIYIYINIIIFNRITTLQFVFWNRKFKRLYREIRPSDFPETGAVGFVLKRPF